MKLNKKYFLVIFLVLVVLFILINSMFNSDMTIALSQIPKKIVQSFIPFGKYKWLDEFLIHKIRKFAHFMEFFVLGIVFTKLYYLKNITVQRLANTLFAFFSIAFLDETIQYFVGRESKVSDIWLDLLGATTGFALCILVYLIIKTIKRKRCENND